MPQEYFCPGGCARIIEYGTNLCPHCKSCLTWSRDGPILNMPPVEIPRQTERKQNGIAKIPRASVPGIIDILMGIIWLIVWASQNDWWEPNWGAFIYFWTVATALLLMIGVGIYCMIAKNWRLGIGIMDIASGICALVMGGLATHNPKNVLTAVVFIPIGIIAIIGGVFCIRGRRWNIALAGSIAAIFSTIFFAGIVATILTGFYWKEDFK